MKDDGAPRLLLAPHRNNRRPRPEALTLSVSHPLGWLSRRRGRLILALLGTLNWFGRGDGFRHEKLRSLGEADHERNCNTGRGMGHVATCTGRGGWREAGMPPMRCSEVGSGMSHMRKTRHAGTLRVPTVNCSFLTSEAVHQRLSPYLPFPLIRGPIGIKKLAKTAGWLLHSKIEDVGNMLQVHPLYVLDTHTSATSAIQIVITKDCRKSCSGPRSLCVP